MGEGGIRWRTRYLSMVALETSWPKRCSSALMRGVRQVGFSRLIWRTRMRTSASIGVRPGLARDFQRQ